MTAFKCLINSVNSTTSTKFMTIDIRNFYLITSMERFEYMKLPIDITPEEIITQYNLRQLEHDNSHIYIEIRKGMYILPQAVCIANDQLQKHQAKYGSIILKSLTVSGHTQPETPCLRFLLTIFASSTCICLTTSTIH